MRADRHAGVLQRVGPFVARDLPNLIGIEDLRPPALQLRRLNRWGI